MLPAPAPVLVPRAGRAPRLELADIVRAHGAAYRQTHVLARAQGRALRAIAQCRTAALGGHRAVCATCGTERITYNSCRNRHSSTGSSFRPRPPRSPASAAIPAISGAISA